MQCDLIQLDKLKYDEQGLIPVVVQEFDTKEVLMLAYANKEALQKSIEGTTAWYYSRSRKELWNKGATSSHYQYIQDIRIDCDEDTVLYIVKQVGAACHTGAKTCFYRNIKEI